MRLKSTKSTIAVLGVVVALIVAATAGLFWVQRGWLVEATDQLRDKEMELKDGERIARRRDEARQALEADRSLVANLEPGVSNAAYVPTLLKQLETLATATRNKVVGVRPQVATQAPSKIQQRRDPNAQAKSGGEAEGDEKEEKEVEEPYTRLEIEVNLVGRFDTTQRFVDQLMRFPKIVSVDQLTLKPKTGSGKDAPPGLLDVQLKLTAFIMKGEVPVLAPPTREIASANVGGIN
jgi:Tfp pilus assembly protein PilO